MAAPVFQQSSTYTTANAAGDVGPPIPFPATVNADDVLVAACISDAGSGRFQAPSGWAGIIGNSYLSLFWKRAVGTESGTQTFPTDQPASPTFWMGGVMYRFSGCITTGTPFELNAGTSISTSTTVPIPALSGNTTGIDRLVCNVTMMKQVITASTGNDNATNYAEQDDQNAQTSSAFQNQCAHLYTVIQAAIGNPGSDSYTQTQFASNRRRIFALIPAAAAGYANKPFGSLLASGDKVLSVASADIDNVIGV